MKLAADANVLLSVLIGGRSSLVIRHPQIEEILTTEPTFAEVEEYALLLARKKRLAPDMILLAMAALPVTVVPRIEYARSIVEAQRRIGLRVPDDVPLLALALHRRLSLWSNDRDFEGVGVDLFTTTRLLRHLQQIE